MSRAKSAAFSIVLVVLTSLLAFGAGEGILRIKNSSMKNYDIEMWRYANTLKIKSPDPAMDFDHVRSQTAVLQNVSIRLNQWGLRGEPIEPLLPDIRRILFLGGSITLGWGVSEDDTVEAQLQKMLIAAGENVQVLNGGVGNYNTQRYVERFFTDLEDLKPTDIVVHYFLRDAEVLPPGHGNFLLRHSELAVTLWSIYYRFVDHSGEQSLVDHYHQVYQPTTPGFLIMRSELKRLADYATGHGIRIYLAMVPDIHNLVDYKFGFVDDIMHAVADQDGYTFVDLLPVLSGRPPEELFAMPGDPHPNALGHRLMAEGLFPVVARNTAGSGEIRSQR